MTQQAKNNKKNLLMHFKGYEDFVSRILDLEDKAKRYRKVIFTPFLNVKEQEIVYQIINDCFVSCDGGYENSEMKRLSINIHDEEVAFPITCLSDTYDMRYHDVNHRDVLGALMNLGIKRNVFGDIIINDGRIMIYVEKELEDYFITHLTQIKRCYVNLKVSTMILEKEDVIEYKEYTVSSFRLDVIVACICNFSRTHSKAFITGKKVKVNQVILEDCDYLCNNNSTISIRGYGRFIMLDQLKKTRKDRYLIQIGKYI